MARRYRVGARSRSVPYPGLRPGLPHHRVSVETDSVLHLLQPGTLRSFCGQEDGLTELLGIDWNDSEWRSCEQCLHRAGEVGAS